MIFHDRIQAAHLLAPQLRSFRDRRPLILGIPRGAMPMAKVLADDLGGDLDVVLVHKIGAPGNPEYAIGSVSEFGTVYLTDSEYHSTEVDPIAVREIEKLKNRRKSYSPVHSPISPKGRIVIIIDDGIATGSTMLAAVRAVRGQKPARIVVAAPVASRSALDYLEREADEVIVFEKPKDFYAISQFYEEFPQVTDEEVFEILSEKKMSIKSA